MGKKINTALTVSAAAAAVTGVIGFKAFDEVINRNAKIFSKLCGGVSDKKTGTGKDKEPTPAQKKIKENNDWARQQNYEEFTFINERGQSLKGWLLRSDEPSDVFVFCSHGYRSSGFGEYGKFFKFYNSLGYNVFFVDHQAAGKSAGKYIGFGYYESSDALEWLDFLKEHFGSEIKIILHGISMGCATVLLMSSSDRIKDNVKFIIADCGFTSAWNQFEFNLKSWHVPAFPVLNVANGCSKIIAGYDFKDTNTIECVKNAKVPILFIHGSEDDFVPTYMCDELYNACNSEYKEKHIIEGAWHAESYKVSPDEYEGYVKGFIDRYIK